jgi:hypothetical protein
LTWMVWLSFLIRNTSTWIVWLINKMCDFGHQRFHVWVMRRCIIHRELHCGLHLKWWTGRANFLWRQRTVSTI